MKKKFTFYISLLSLFSFANAQTIDYKLNAYGVNFPTEKLHLHTDKESYIPGQTIWFKAYILADGLPSEVSTNLYADLLDGNGKLVQHKTMPVFSSTADSYFTLPDTPQSNTYYLRAYTTWMLNFDTAFIYHKAINIINPLQRMPPTPVPDVSLQFFSEGGNFINGLYNYVAFKATQSNGMPYELTAAIKNNNGELVDSIKTIHNGMGMLKFTPEAGQSYTAEWKDNKDQYRKTSLPIAQNSGILLHAEQVKDDLYYLISTPAITQNMEELTVIATINQRAVYTATLKPIQTSVTQKINTKNFETGILQLTVIDKNNQPLAERIVFINNNNYSFTTKLTVKENSTAKRAKNSIEIEVPDTLNSNLSIAVYDANLEEQQPQTNIYTNLLLQADVKGYIHQANWYFTNNTPEAKQYLDLVLQTNGWRRYNWDAILNQKLPQLQYPRDNYLSIYGKAANAKQQPKATELITLIVQTADSAKQWYMPLTNKEGLFTQSGLVFYDTATVFYKLNNSKDKTTGIGIAKVYNGLVNVKLQSKPPAYLPIQTAVAQSNNTAYTQTFLTELKNKNPNFEQKAKVLSEVVVKANNKRNWKNDPLLKMDEKYAGIYKGIGPNTWAFDVANDEMRDTKFDIYNYMIGKVPGLTVISDGTGTKRFSYRESMLLPQPPIALFVNESEVENDYISLINLESIAYVKFYTRVASRQGFPPGIVIYLTKGDDLKNQIRKMPSNLSQLKMAGYSPIKEFYTPDYSMPDAKHTNADLRSTLLWQPYILTDKNNPKALISFYNNDISTKLKVVLEGMNEEGKLIHIEKIIE